MAHSKRKRQRDKKADKRESYNFRNLGLKEDKGVKDGG